MKKIDRDNCPIHRATNILKDQWSVLVIREFFLEGSRKFSDLQAQLKLSPNTLSDRLKRLEEAGVIDRHLYTQHPPRAEYRLTEKGAALAPVMDALYDWGAANTPDL
jgi:DNA-binding HxlR family transcriptional regulator